VRVATFVAAVLCASITRAENMEMPMMGKAADKPAKAANHEVKHGVQPRLLHEHPTLVAMRDENNRLRAEVGLPPHKITLRLTKLAQAHAEYMASTYNFAHNYTHGLPEIIQMGNDNVYDAFQGWKSSPPHYAAILGGYTECGYGVARAENGTLFWCGVFAGQQTYQATEGQTYYRPTYNYNYTPRRRGLFRRR